MAESKFFTYVNTPIDNDTIKYHFLNANGNKVSYAEFINLLHLGDENFLDTFKIALNDATNELSAYFWECPPVSKESTNKPFEFVVTKSKQLSYIKQDYSSFKEKIIEDLNKDVFSFSNLGKDATLIIPKPCHDLDYKNLSNFTINAPKEQQIKFWQEVANKLTENLEFGTSKWLSTNGLGVHYLHVRIDDKPKNYSWQEYLLFKQSRSEKIFWKMSNLKLIKEKIFPFYKKNLSINSLLQPFNYNRQKTVLNVEPKAEPNVEPNVEPKIDLKARAKL
ncbi:12329_t:CDS:1 [Dentiscutata erythropus]|uniref:12329_t:CDS:1 n=1 Tax=Dentiscutata erythropus TaxID=1348616 RepID=A0A9N9J690_9GLOM|nr:12329_t:CDS:1 [Dentiscutata erythropus]